MSIRLLIGWTDDLGIRFNERAYQTFKERGVELLTFAKANADIILDAYKHDHAFLEAELAARRFQPDLAIIATGGYGFLLEGIEHLRFPVFLLNCEWFFTAWNLRHVSFRVDQIMVNLESSTGPVRRLTGKEAFGISLPFWDEMTEFFPIPGAEKTLDVVYVGNVNPRVYPERTRFLARLALLPERYSVFIGDTYAPDSGIRYEETNRINNRARICVNYSAPLVKSVNTRIVHTLLSGAFLLTEHQEDEAAFLKEGVHCAFFNEENVEAVIEHYLRHDEERERMAANGLELARSRIFYFPTIVLQFLDQLGPPPYDRHRTKRMFLDLPRWRRLNLLGMEAFHSIIISRRAGLERALRYFQEALAAEPGEPEIHNNLGVILGHISLSGGREERLEDKALGCFQKSQALAGTDLLALFNEACLYRRQLAWEEFGALAARMSRLLDAPGPPLADLFPHEGLVLAATLNFVSNKKWQEIPFRSFHEGTPTEEFHREVRGYILWHLNVWLAEFAAERGDYDTAAARYREAASHCPDSDELFEALARALLKTRSFEEARAAFEHTLALNPFNLDAAAELINLLFVRGEVAAGEELARRCLLICRRVKPFISMAELFEGLAD